MANYSGLSNLSREDQKRLQEVATSTGEGVTRFHRNGTLITPVRHEINFIGSGVSAANDTDGMTTYTIPGGGGVGVSISASEWSPTGTQAVPADATTTLNMFQEENFQDDGDWTRTNDTTLTCNRSGASNRYKFTFQWTMHRSNSVADDDGLLDLAVNGTPVRATVWSDYGQPGNTDIASFHLTCTAVIALNDTVTTRMSIQSGGMTFDFTDAGSFAIIERMN